MGQELGTDYCLQHKDKRPHLYRPFEVASLKVRKSILHQKLKYKFLKAGAANDEP